jgi:hypothetical protein
VPGLRRGKQDLTARTLTPLIHSLAGIVWRPNRLARWSMRPRLVSIPPHRVQVRSVGLRFPQGHCGPKWRQLTCPLGLLNHQSGSFRGVCGVYQRHRYAAEKKAALDLWAAHVSNLIPAPGIGLPLAA